MKFIQIAKQGPVGVLTMNCHGQNRFDDEFCDDLMEALDAVEKDTAIKSLVITGGEEKYWSTGLNLDYVTKLKGDAAIKFFLNFNGVLRRLCIYPRPTVAAINGHCFAGGVVMASHLDYRFMRADKGWVCLPGVDIGLVYTPGIIAILRAIMPPGSVRHLVYTGKKFSPAESKALGFIDEIHSKDDLLPKAIEWASFLATKSIPTYAEIKRRMRADVIKVIDEVDTAMFKANKA